MDQENLEVPQIKQEQEEIKEHQTSIKTRAIYSGMTPALSPTVAPGVTVAFAHMPVCQNTEALFKNNNNNNKIVKTSIFIVSMNVLIHFTKPTVISDSIREVLHCTAINFIGKWRHLLV